MRVRPEDSVTKATWLKVGSIKPESSADPIWIRGKMMALHLRHLLESAADDIINKTFASMNEAIWDYDPKDPYDPNAANLGLIISMEYPTPMNDFLVALNRIIHLVFFETDLWKKFATVRVLTTNAATLRSLMNLTKKGAKNKAENIDRAYEYIDKAAYPKLDTDACDAVLMTMMARYVSSVLLGHPEEVPERFLIALCNASQEMKGKGRNSKIITKGLLHRREYWYLYQRKEYTLVVADASSTYHKLERRVYTL